MSRHHATIRTALFLVAAFIPGRSMLMAQGRDTLETKVTVSGNEIILKWTKKHPWDAELIARGVSLFAEYRTSRGVGLECMQPANVNNAAANVRRGGVAGGACFSGNPAVRRDDRTIHFQLPEALTAEPLGAVCLEFRLLDQRILPIRQATNQREDTARFEYQEWARNVTGRAQLTTLEARRGTLQNAVSAQAAAVKEQEESNVRKGWESPQTCEKVTGGTVQAVESNRPVAAPADQDKFARMMCLIRLFNGEEPSTATSPVELAPHLDAVDPALRKQWNEVRGAQISTFLDDWNNLSPEIPAFLKRFPIPHFGTYDEDLELQSLSAAAGQRVLQAEKNKSKPDPRDVLGYVGGSVEAYDRCVRDGKRQLDLNYQQAQALKTVNESLPERLRLQAVQECREGVTKLETMRARLTGYQKDLADLERQMGEFNAASLAGKSRDLNSITCVP